MGTCKRRTCECDMALVNAVEVHWNSKNMNYKSCVVSSGVAADVEPACCKKSELFTYYNKKTHSCCTGGEVAKNGECWKMQAFLMKNLYRNIIL